MNNTYDFDRDRIFDSCDNFCQNCKNCANFNEIFAKKVANLPKEQQSQVVFESGNPCKTLMLLSEVAKLNMLTIGTQFERVIFFYQIREFLSKTCGCSLVLNYNRRYMREWAQVLLYTYNSIPNICKIIEDVVDERAMARSMNFGLNIHNENTFDQMDNIINLLDRKTRLINLHVKVKRAVMQLSGKMLETAKIRYFERKNPTMMAQKLNVSVRTCQRRIEQLLDCFCDLMPKYGIDCDDVLFEVGRFDPWLLEWFRLDMKTVGFAL